MTTYSFSKLNTYLGCGFAYEWKYEMGNYDCEKNDHFAIGGGVSKFLEEYGKNRGLTIRELRQIYLKEALTNPAVADKKFVQKFVELVDVYVNSKKRLAPMIIKGRPAVEVPFKITLPGTKITLKGAIDIITRCEALVDYKALGRPMAQSVVDNYLEGYGLQLSTYTIPYYDWFSKMPRKVGFQVLLKDFTIPQKVAGTRTNKQRLETIDFIVETDRDIKSKKFPKKPSWKCKTCLNLLCDKRGKRL